MGLLNARNLQKAKAALDKNRDKVADAVGKATSGLDKVSKGKTSAVSAKVNDAARKYAGADDDPATAEAQPAPAPAPPPHDVAPG